jgi:hypothetical protein
MKLSICLSSLLALSAMPALADANGDLWEVTTQMTMEGMPAGMGMPAQTRRVCTAHEWTKPPVSQDERGCKASEFTTTPTKTTWKITCPDVTGSAEITRTSPDAYTGWMKMTMAQGTMTMNLTGKRVGDCDAGEAKKEREAQVARVQAQVAAGQQAAADSQAQTCMTLAQAGDLQQFKMLTDQGMCADPKYKATLCDSIKKCDVYKSLLEREKSQPEYGLQAVAQFCAADVVTLTKACCDEAVKTEDVNFIAAQCPTQAKEFALQKCAGLGYSALLGSKWQSFCTTYAKEVMSKGTAKSKP